MVTKTRVALLDMQCNIEVLPDDIQATDKGLEKYLLEVVDVVNMGKST